MRDGRVESIQSDLAVPLVSCTCLTCLCSHPLFTHGVLASTSCISVQLTRRFLPIPGSTVPAHRSFPASSFVLNPIRSRASGLRANYINLSICTRNLQPLRIARTDAAYARSRFLILVAVQSTDCCTLRAIDPPRRNRFLATWSYQQRPLCDYPVGSTRSGWTVNT